MTELAGFQIPLPPWVVLPVYLTILASLAYLLGGVMRSLWAKRAARTAGRLDDVLVDALPGPVAAALFLAGCYVALVALSLPVRWMALSSKLFRLALIVVLVVALLRLLVGLVGDYTARNPTLAPATNVAKIITRLFVLAMGVLMIFDAMGVAIAPILTTLGVGSLAVALALQDTLANFFSGLYLLADRPIVPGDFVQIEGGVEGTVHSIGWRTTRILTMQNNIVVVPNAKLSQSVITNTSQPQSSLVGLLTVGVAYDTDVDRAEAVLLDEYTKSVGVIDGLVTPPPDPRVLLTNFGDSALDLLLVVHARDFRVRGLVLEALRRRILARFRAEGIEIPFPQRVVHSAQSAKVGGSRRNA